MSTYDGTEYFWDYEYRYPMRDLTPAARKRVHAKMVKRGLDPDGRSAAHKQAIIDALWKRDRERLAACYGPVTWSWWNA